MHNARLYIILMTLPLFAFGADCPVSLPIMTDPEGTLSAAEKYAWYGTEDLAALMPRFGHWEGMEPSANYGNKFWWWSRNSHNELNPVLVVAGELLDQPKVKARALIVLNAQELTLVS